MPEHYPILEECTRNGDDWIHKCGTTLLGARVFHPVHDGPFELSGSGRVVHEIVPYCPTCEERPSERGAPIKEDPADVQERDILRRMRGQ